jgi:hypothetical protein
MIVASTEPYSAMYVAISCATAAHRFPYRPAPWPSASAHRFRLLQILGYRVAADSQFARHPPDTPALVQHLVSQHMHLIHLQYSPSSGFPPESTARDGSFLER